MNDNKSAEQVAEVMRLLGLAHTLVADASPSRLATMRSALAKMVGPTHARDMSPTDYANAKAEATRIVRRV